MTCLVLCVPFPKRNEEQNEDFERAVDVVRRRLDVLEKKYKQKRAWCGGLLKTDVLVEGPLIVEKFFSDCK